MKKSIKALSIVLLTLPSFSYGRHGSGLPLVVNKSSKPVFIRTDGKSTTILANKSVDTDLVIGDKKHPLCLSYTKGRGRYCFFDEAWKIMYARGEQAYIHYFDGKWKRMSLNITYYNKKDPGDGTKASYNVSLTIESDGTVVFRNYYRPLIDELTIALQAGPLEKVIKTDSWKKMLNVLRDKKTDVNVKFPDGDRLIHKLAELGPLKNIIKDLVERKEGNKADINARGKNGRTALMIAASKYPHGKLMDYLLAKGADRKARDKFGSNVLHYIVTSQDLSFADSAANINKLLSIKGKIDKNLMKMIDEKETKKIPPLAASLLLKQGIYPFNKVSALETAKMQYAFSKSARQVKAAERYSKLIKYLEDIKKKPKEAARRREYQRWYDKPEDIKKKPKAGLSEKDKAALRQRWYGK